MHYQLECINLIVVPLTISHAGKILQYCFPMLILFSTVVIPVSTHILVILMLCSSLCLSEVRKKRDMQREEISSIYPVKIALDWKILKDLLSFND